MDMQMANVTRDAGVCFREGEISFLWWELGQLMYQRLKMSILLSVVYKSKGLLPSRISITYCPFCQACPSLQDCHLVFLVIVAWPWLGLVSCLLVCRCIPWQVEADVWNRTE